MSSNDQSIDMFDCNMTHFPEVLSSPCWPPTSTSSSWSSSPSWSSPTLYLPSVLLTPSKEYCILKKIDIENLSKNGDTFCNLYTMSSRSPQQRPSNPIPGGANTSWQPLQQFYFQPVLCRGIFNILVFAFVAQLCLKSCHHIFLFFVSLFDNEAHRYGIFSVLCSLDYSLVGQPTTDNDLLLPGST